MTVSVQEFIKQRRNRALGSILGHSERSAWWTRMQPAEREALRSVVIDALNSYHDVVLDLIKAEDGVRNEEVVELLSRIDRNTRQRHAAAAG